MKRKSVDYFDWKEIQVAICAEMGIDDADFRDYHRLRGGGYNDLWHEWIAYFDYTTPKGAIVHFDLHPDDEEETLESIAEDGKQYLTSFVNAVYVVFNKYNIEYIKYS